MTEEDRSIHSSEVGNSSIFIRKFNIWIHGAAIEIVAPKIVCLCDRISRDDTALFLKKIYDTQSSRRQRRIVVNLENVEFMSGSAALGMLANIARIRIRMDSKDIVVVIPPRDKTQRRLFARSGLKYALSLSPKHLKKLTEERYFFSTSCDPATHYQYTCAVLEEIHPKNKEFISTAVQEAMLNVVDHAYGWVTMDKELYNRWWQYSFLMNGIFNFLIYDLGQSVPAVMGKMALGNLSDSELVKVAMKLGVTSTRDEGRGKGSADIKRAVENLPGSHLMIFSRNGVYTYSDFSEKCEIINSPLPGTMIQWMVPLK